MDLEGLLHPDILDRLRRAEAGQGSPRALRLGALAPGDVGVVTATVTQVAPVRTFRRKNGTEGLIGRVSLDDGTGEVDLVLWDEENRQVRDGTLRAGQRVRIRGAAAKAGFRGGVELSLGKAVLEQVGGLETATLTGTLVAMEPTQVVDGRFQAEAVLRRPEGEARVVLWDDAVRTALELVGRPARIDGASAHPLLDGWFLGDQARIREDEERRGDQP